MTTNEFLMDLQLFADDNDNKDNDPEKKGAEQKGEENNDDGQAFFSKAEVEAMLQKEADRRVSAARKKFEAEMEQKLEKERKEAQKLARMSEEEKIKHTLEEQRAQLEERERQLLEKELKLEASKILSEKKLPVSFVDLLVTPDAEQTHKNIEVFEGAFRDAVAEAVDARLGQSSQRPGSGASQLPMNREEFKKLDYKGRLALMNSDPELYNKLSQEHDS